MSNLFSTFQNIPLGFGGASISGEGGGYGFGAIGEDEAINLLLEAFDLGIKVFDTAPIYGFGLSEKRIGKAFKNKREEVFIISKSGVTWHSTKRVNMTNDPIVCRKMLEDSLKNMNTDYIDLYMIHWPDKTVDIRRPLEVLYKAKEKNLINHIGLCNTNEADLLKALEVSPIAAVQSEFNLFNNKEAETLFPLLTKEKISFMGWGTLDKGIISGRVDKSREFDKEDARSWAPWWKKSNKDKKIEVIQKIKGSKKYNSLDFVSLALSFNLSYENVNLCLVGPRNKNQLRQLLSSYKQNIDIETIKEIQEFLKKEGF